MQSDNIYVKTALHHICTGKSLLAIAQKSRDTGSNSKNLTEIQETQVQFLGWEVSSREGIGNPLQYSCLENSMDRGA